MKKIYIMILLQLLVACSNNEQKKEIEVKTDFQAELFKIIQKDTFDQVVICNSKEYSLLIDDLKNRLGNPFFLLTFYDNVNIRKDFIINNRILRVDFKFTSINDNKLLLLLKKKCMDYGFIANSDKHFSREVPDSIYLENMNCQRYYQCYMCFNNNDSSLYDFFIPDSAKDKLGLPRDFKSALPILSDTNIFK